jgi:uncharacterized protein YbgA (DUF1722 family)/uncharacterized protein YbbK (DUF523 family)
MAKITLGISTCLLGQNVRYDGGHKLDRYLRDELGRFVEYVPVCPEVEVGLGTPREAMRLVGDAENPRLVTRRTNVDHTAKMKRWAARRVRQLEKEGLCGFIFKSGSPSSGMERVRVYTEKGMPAKRGTGIWARAFMAHFPLLPVEDDGRLHDARLRENFIERVFVYHRWREAAARKARGRLVDFHTRHKLLLLSHSQKHYRLLGKLVARAKEYKPTDLFDEYVALLIEAMAVKPSERSHVNVLQHLLGYFKKELSADEKQEFLDLVGEYRAGLVPLIVPITLANHFVRKYDQPYLKQQVYLKPHPAELRLRNHV